MNGERPERPGARRIHGPPDRNSSPERPALGCGTPGAYALDRVRAVALRLEVRSGRFDDSRKRAHGGECDVDGGRHDRENEEDGQ